MNNPLVAALAETYIQKVSTHELSAFVETQRGQRITTSQVSAITAKLDATIAAWQ